MRTRILAYFIFGVLFSLTCVGLNFYQPTKPSNGITSNTVFEIYANLQKYSGLPNAMPPLEIVPTMMVNAWMSPDGMFVTIGIMKFVKNQDELAAVIGHEMGHYILRHFWFDDDSRLKEANADKIGAYLMFRAGYNICAIEGLWLRMAGTFGDTILTASHPGESQRAYEMHFPICH
jgi:predicted Zn-dependent protease